MQCRIIFVSMLHLNTYKFYLCTYTVTKNREHEKN